MAKKNQKSSSSKKFEKDIFRMIRQNYQEPSDGEVPEKFWTDIRELLTSLNLDPSEVTMSSEQLKMLNDGLADIAKQNGFSNSMGWALGGAIRNSFTQYGYDNVLDTQRKDIKVFVKEQKENLNRVEQQGQQIRNQQLGAIQQQGRASANQFANLVQQVQGTQGAQLAGIRNDYAAANAQSFANILGFQQNIASIPGFTNVPQISPQDALQASTTPSGLSSQGYLDMFSQAAPQTAQALLRGIPNGGSFAQVQAPSVGGGVGGFSPGKVEAKDPAVVLLNESQQASMNRQKQGIMGFST